MSPSTVHFGKYELDTVRFELRRDGRTVKLQRRPCELLLFLIENQGSIVTREQIAERLWGPGFHVDSEHNINTAIRKVRYALRDTAERHQYIQTVVGKGYQFIGETTYQNGVNPALLEQPPPAVVAKIPPPPAPPVIPPIDAPSPVIPPRSHKGIAVSTLIVIAAALLLVLSLWLLGKPQKRAPDLPRVKAIAVLPFRNLTRDQDQDFVLDSLTDELTTNLAQLHAIRVISRNSAMQFRNTKASLSRIRSDLGVDAVVEGSAWYSDGHLRVSVQLLDTRKDGHLWAKLYDPGKSGTLGIQAAIVDDASRQITAALQLDSGGRHWPNHVQNAQAYDDYLRGRYFWNKRTLDGLEKSIGYYRHALELDPQYPDAYAALGDSYVILSSYGGQKPAESLSLAKQNALRALELNPKLGDAHAVLAAVKVDNDWDWEGAAEEYRLALRLSPEYPTAHHWYALHLSRLGRHAEAETEIEQALQLDPLSLIINTDAGEIYYRSGKLDRAVRRLRKATDLDANFADAHLVMGEVNEREKKFADAVEEFRLAKKLFNNTPNAIALEGHALALQGDREHARQIVQELETLAGQRYVSGVDIGIVYCALGDSAAAMTWFNRAYERRDKGLNILAADPLFANCRADPGFRNLLSKLRLPVVPLQ